MPQPIYMPQDPSKIGNMFAPVAQQTSNFLWNMLGQRIAQQRQAELAKTQLQYDLEKQEREERLKREELRSEEKRTETTAQSRVISANLTAQSRLEAAEMAAKARTDAAQIYSDAKKAVLRLNAKYKKSNVTPSEIQKFYSQYAPWYIEKFGKAKFEKDYPKGIMSVANEYFKTKGSNLLSFLMGGGMVGASQPADELDEIEKLNKEIEELEKD